MFSHDNYVTLMFTMRIGKQGIPIWFKSFKQEYINKEKSLEKGKTIAFINVIIKTDRNVNVKSDNFLSVFCIFVILVLSHNR